MEALLSLAKPCGGVWGGWPTCKPAKLVQLLRVLVLLISTLLQLHGLSGSQVQGVWCAWQAGSTHCTSSAKLCCCSFVVQPRGAQCEVHVTVDLVWFHSV